MPSELVFEGFCHAEAVGEDCFARSSGALGRRRCGLALDGKTVSGWAEPGAVLIAAVFHGGRLTLGQMASGGNILGVCRLLRKTSSPGAS